MGAPAPTAPSINSVPARPPSSSSSPLRRHQPSPTSSSASFTSDPSHPSSDHTPTASPTRSSPSTPSPPQVKPSPQRPSRIPPPPPVPNPPGLFNLGNTCYLNSVVQVLYHIAPFRAALTRYHPRHHHEQPLHHFACQLTGSLRAVFISLDDAYNAAENQRPDPRTARDSPLPDLRDSALKLSASTDQNLTDDLILHENIDYVAPQHIINLLRDHDRCLEFDARGQQDAHEFLRFLLDKVNDCMQMDNEQDQMQQNSRSPNSNTCPYDNPQSIPPDVPPLQHHPPTTNLNRMTRAPDHPASSSRKQNCQSNGPLDPPNRNDDDLPGHGVHAPIHANATAQPPTADPDQTKPSLLETRAPDVSSLSNAAPTSLGPDSHLAKSDESPHKSPATKRRRYEMESDVGSGHQEENGPKSAAQTAERATTLSSEATGDSHCSDEEPHINACDVNAKYSSSFERRSSEQRPAKRYRRNLIPDLFQGRAVTATRCYECESQSQRSEMFLDVSLPVQYGRSLAWALSTQCVEEQLLGSNKYFCNNCKTYTEAKRWWQVAALPEVLTVHLKLFAYGTRLTGVGGKVSVAMPCPSRTKLAEWCESDCAERDNEYALTAVIVHEGTGASSGHYYSYICKPDQEEQWYCFDDSFVTAVSEDEVKQRLFTSMKTKRTAYLLFYSNSEDLRIHASRRN